MTYSIIGILASILLVITNRDVLWKTDGSTLTRTQRVYRMFLRGAGRIVRDLRTPDQVKEFFLWVR